MIKKLFSLFIVSLLIISGISLELVEANNQIPQKPIDSLDIPKLSSGFFTENKGQWDSEFLYMGNTSFGKVAFTKDAIYYQLIKTEKRNERSERSERSEKDINCINPKDIFDPMSGLSEEQEEKFESQIIKLSFVNPQTPKVKPEGLLTHYNNYFIGNDSNKWATECHNYTKVYYEDIWNGIDLAYFFNDEGLKYEFYAKPYSNISNIKIDVQGADLEIENNKLKIDTPIGSLFDSNLISYTEESNKQINISFNKEDNTYGFQIEPNFKTNETIIIDPLIYSTFVGGSSADYGQSIAIDSSGNAYVTGRTNSTFFPTTSGAYDNISNGGYDVFVFKLNSTGSGLIYSTFVGGSSTDYGQSITVDSSGNAYVTGYTNSSNFPTTSDAYQIGLIYSYDAFVFKLNSTGSELIYSTYMGGSNTDQGSSIAVDSSGYAYVTGYTQSTNFPTKSGAYDRTHNGGQDVFVFKLNPTGSELIYSTYVGGSSADYGYSIAVDSSGNAYVTGSTNSSNFPTTSGAYDRTHNSNEDAFVFKLNSTGSELIYSTFVGGSTADHGYSIAVDSSGYAYVAGYTSSNNFPTTDDAYDTTHNSNYDVFVFKLNPTGSELIYSTYVGGSAHDYGYSITVDSSGYAYVTGGIYSTNFPVTDDAFQVINRGGYDAFVFKLNSTGSELIYSTYMGGSSTDYGYGIAVDSRGYAYVTGYTNSSNFPTIGGAYDTTHNGNYDVFVFKLLTPIPPSIPYPLQGILYFDVVYLYWSESTEGTYPIKGYQIYRANVSHGIFQPLAFVDGADSTSYVDTTGLVGNVYSYYVVAVDIIRYKSAPSNIVIVGPILPKPAIEPPSRPYPLKGTLDLDTVYLSWNKSTKGNYPIKGYQIYRANLSEDGIFQPLAFVDGVDSTSYTDTSVLVGNTYSYYVVAVDIMEYSSAPSNIVTLGPPTSPSPLYGVLHFDTVYLSWHRSARGTYPIIGYQIYRADVSDGIFQSLAFVDGADSTSYVDTTGLIGNTYSYYVVAVDENRSRSAPSNIVTLGPLQIRPPSNPSPLYGILYFDVVYLSWNRSAKGTYPIKGYQIYRANVSDEIYIPLIFLDEADSTSYVDTTGLLGNTYSYYVVAVDINGNSSTPSNIVIVGPILDKPEAKLPSSPSPLKGTLYFDIVYLSWNKSTEGTYLVKGYQIYRANYLDGILFPLAFVNGADSTSYTDTTGLVGNTYSYYVVAVDIMGYTSIPSNIVTIGPLLPKPETIPPSIPSPLYGTLYFDTVYLSWNKSTEGTYPIKGYQIYRANVSDGIYQSIAFVNGVNSTSYVDTTGLVGNTYSYYVVAVDINGNSSIRSNTVIVGPLIEPQPSLFLSPELNRKEYYPNDEVIIKMSIMNKGNRDATNVKLTMTLPQDIEYVKADLLRGSVFGSSVEFNVGNIIAGNTTTFHIFCKVKSNIRNDKSVDIIFDVTCKENSTDRKAVHLLIKPKRGEVKPLSIGIYLKNIKSDPDTGEAYIDFDTSLELTLKIDGGSTPYTLNIDWGDGSSKEEKKVDAAEINLTHKFISRGSIEIKFEVTDSVGRNKKATVKLKVK